MKGRDWETSSNLIQWLAGLSCLYVDGGMDNLLLYSGFLFETKVERIICYFRWNSCSSPIPTDTPEARMTKVAASACRRVWRTRRPCRSISSSGDSFFCFHWFPVECLDQKTKKRCFLGVCCALVVDGDLERFWGEVEQTTSSSQSVTMLGAMVQVATWDRQDGKWLKTRVADH